ncbi:hypothetical protein DMW54_25080, partial [Serratia marcescens]
MKWGIGMDCGLTAHYQGKDPFEAFSASYTEDLDPSNIAWTRESGYKALEAYLKYYQEIDKQWEVVDTQVKDNLIKTTLVIDLV